MLPLPDFVNEPFPPHIMTGQSLLSLELLLHHYLSGYTSMISTWVPECSQPTHTLPVRRGGMLGQQHHNSDIHIIIRVEEII